MGAILNGLALSKVRPFGSGFLIFSDYGREPIRLGRAHGDAGHLHLHARLDRRRRGRPDPPADRAARLAAGDPRPDRAPPRRRQRGGRGLAVHHAAPARARRAGPDAARRCRPSTARSTPPASGLPQGAYVLADAHGGDARRDPARHRQRGLALRRGLRAARRPRASRPASSACRRGSCSSSSRTSIATACSRRGVTARVAVEQASTFGWSQYVGLDRRASSACTTFGASAPLKELQQKFGFTAERRRRSRQGATGEGEQGLRRARHGDPAC